ncbi:DUF3021 family protein [Lactococcus chungangensis]|uniref:DUF3021 family protein n=2 Tax=Pseudolactococcus chungangensis CAU 28 = DSM 22330 TaxID=1122154 RepID=A0A1K2HBL8_9LACT|nr:DUF3021 family protein [Lactococcus chungangensis]SFZ74135.1 Protein of unknown function [Lactococcus chungangensis CAU 28 = DSM 22330]
MSILQRCFKALGIGSFIYLLILFINNGVVVYTSEVIYVFAISIFIALTSYIFNIDALNFITCLVIHYILVDMFVIIVNYAMHFTGNYSNLFFSIFIIYVVSFIITTIQTRLTVKQLNHLIGQVHLKH